jgi:hypothetical protein
MMQIIDFLAVEAPTQSRAQSLGERRARGLPNRRDLLLVSVSIAGREDKSFAFGQFRSISLQGQHSCNRVLAIEGFRACAVGVPNALRGAVEDYFIILAAPDDCGVGSAFLLTGDSQNTAIGVDVLATPAQGSRDAIEKRLHFRNC